MHPSQVLDLQADLLICTTNLPWLKAVGSQMQMGLVSAKTDGSQPDIVKAKQAATNIVARLHDEVQRAYAYYVAPEMTDLIEWAADGLDDTDAFRVDEVPTPHGFVYFEKPIRMTDIRGKTMYVNAALWFKSDFRYDDGSNDQTTGYGVVTFNDYRNTPDDIALELLEKGGYQIHEDGRWGMIGMQGMVDGVRIGPRLVTQAAYTDQVTGEIHDDPQPFTNIIRIMHAYWMILNQSVTHLSEAEIPRAFAKRARRMHIPDRVTVVALRRVEGHSHGDHDVEWHHRWMVRGHWRWQHVSEHHPLAEPDPEGGYRARVWVRPHIKGPEDKPLHLTDKVYALVR